MQKYANHYGWSDVNPFEVIREVSEKTLEIRAMDAEQDLSVKPNFQIGGFSAVSDNNQKWDIKSNPNRPAIRIRLSKKGIWKDKNGNKYYLSDTPTKFYDYNF